MPCFRNLWHRALSPTEAFHRRGMTAERLKALPLPLIPEEWPMLREGLPRLPEGGRALPWMVLLAPLGVLGLWFWILRGFALAMAVR